MKFPCIHGKRKVWFFLPVNLGLGIYVQVLTRIKQSPVAARAVPFVVFVALTATQGKFGPGSLYWLYVARTFIGGWLIWSLRSALPEMRWTFSWEALAAGIGVFVMWVGLEGLYPSLDFLLSNPSKHHWNPHDYFGQDSPLAWFVISVRILGSSCVVPPIEELFYRSLMYRAIEKQDFQSMPLSQFRAKGFFITALIFGLAHREWLPGILCGLAYQALVLRRGHLGDAMTAHGITNFLLGVWVVYKGAWNFW